MTAPPPKLRVLVTGAAGFIGRHVTTTLLKQGFAVTAADLRPLPHDLPANGTRAVVGDICDPACRLEALRDVKVVCHLSAYMPQSLDDPRDAEACFRINALATLDLAQDAAAAAVGRFVYLSGGNIYAPSGTPCTEESPVYPAGYAAGYLVSKLAGELYAASVCARTGMAGLMLRVGTPYGPGEPPRKVIPTFLAQAAQGVPLRLANGGTAAFNFIHVADVADCVARAAAVGPSGIYNVSSGEHTTLRQTAEAVAALHPQGQVTLDVAPAVPGAFAGFAAMSASKARTIWNFAPRQLADGLRDYGMDAAAAS